MECLLEFVRLLILPCAHIILIIDQVFQLTVINMVAEYVGLSIIGKYLRPVPSTERLLQLES